MMMLMIIYFFNSLIPFSGIFLDILLGPSKWTIIDSVHVQFVLGLGNGFIVIILINYDYVLPVFAGRSVGAG